MPHRFRLQSVLSYRKQLEEALQLELARLEQELRRERSALENLEAHKEMQMETILSYQTAPRLDARQIANAYSYLERVEWSIQRQLELLSSLASQVERKRGEVMAAMQERKVLENLKEREDRRFLEWLNRVEASIVDEIATTQHSRRAREAAEEEERHA